MKKFAILCFSLLMFLSFSGCSDSNRFMNDNEIKDITENPKGTIIFSYKTLDTADSNDERTTRTLNFELYYEKAPITVTNFIKLVNDGFYNDTYCQDYADNMGNDNYLNVDAYVYDVDNADTENIDESELKIQKTLDYTIKGEFSENGWSKNDLKHISGIMSMVRVDNNKDSADFEYMICLDSFTERDGNYAAFGKIDVISPELMNDLIAMGGYNNDFKVDTITVDTNDIDFKAPLMIKK